MSQIVRCCVCDERVRLPDVDSDVWVRCPHCLEEFPLSRIATDLPPRLEVIVEPTLVVDSTDTESKKQAAAKASDDGAGIATMPAVVDAQRPAAAASDIPDGDEAVGTPNPNLHANRVKASGKGNGLAFFKIALGGIAGLMLGQIIIWWLPHPYRSDPFDLAKNVPSKLSFLLPPNEFGSEDALISEASNNVEKEIAVSSPMVEHAMPGSSDDVVPAISDGPPVPPTDLRISVQTAVAEDTAFEERGSYEKRHVESWYEGLRQLSVCVTNITTLSSVNDDVVEQMMAFLVQVASDQEKVSALTKEAVDQIRAGEPVDHQGIVVAGEVLSIKPAGELFRTKLHLIETDMTVDIISRQDPVEKKAYGEKDSVMILGVVLATPRTLQGYKGSDRPVIFGGFPIKVDAFGVEASAVAVDLQTSLRESDALPSTLSSLSQ